MENPIIGVVQVMYTMEGGNIQHINKSDSATASEFKEAKRYHYVLAPLPDEFSHLVRGRLSKCE